METKYWHRDWDPGRSAEGRVFQYMYRSGKRDCQSGASIIHDFLGTGEGVTIVSKRSCSGNWTWDPSHPKRKSYHKTKQPMQMESVCSHLIHVVSTDESQLLPRRA